MTSLYLFLAKESFGKNTNGFKYFTNMFLLLLRRRVLFSKVCVASRIHTVYKTNYLLNVL